MPKPIRQLDTLRAALASGTLTREQWLAAIEAAYGADAPPAPAPPAPTPTPIPTLLGGGETGPGGAGLPRGVVEHGTRLAVEGGERPEPGLPTLAQGSSVPGARSTYDADDSTGIIRRPAFATRETNAVIDSALDFNPDVSHALWMAQRLGLHDWTLTAYKLDANGRTDIVDEDARDEALRFAARVMQAYGGGIDAMLEVGLDSVARRGAVAVELDVADSRTDVLDMDFVDPTLIDFRVERDGGHRSVYPVYQPTPSDAPRRFSPLTFRYEGISKRVGMPHGKSPLLAVVETVPRQMRYRKSLERVAANSAFAKVAVILDWQKVAASAPPDVASVRPDGTVQVIDTKRFNAHMNAVRSDTATALKTMYEDDIWSFFDVAKPDTLGADHAGKTLDPAKMAELFDTDVIAGIHSQPAMHGRSYGHDLSSTGQVQWIVTALGIEAMVEYAVRAVEFALNSYLRIRGIAAEVDLDIPGVRKEDRKAEAEAAKIETEVAIAQMNAGFIDADEAAMRLVGHAAVDGSSTAPAKAEQALALADGAPSTSVTEPGGRVPQAANVDPTRSVTDVDGAHESACACPTCEAAAATLAAVPRFEPAERRAASPAELAGDARFDDEAADEATREWRRDLKKDAPAWAGILDAVEVGAPDDDVAAGGNTLAPAPPSQWAKDRWQWDASISRYRYPPARPGTLGRIVPPDRVRRLLDQRIRKEQAAMRSLARTMLDGRISVVEMQREMARRLGRRHLQARMLAVGGRDRLGADALADVARHWQKDSRFLAEFGQRIARGEMTAQQIVHNAEQYASANLRDTYEDGRTLDAIRAGFREERWVLGIADHCEGCEYQAARGWVAIGELPEIGSQQCRTGCACGKEQRVAEGEQYPSRTALQGHEIVAVDRVDDPLARALIAFPALNGAHR